MELKAKGMNSRFKETSACKRKSHGHTMLESVLTLVEFTVKNISFSVMAWLTGTLVGLFDDNSPHDRGEASVQNCCMAGSEWRFPCANPSH